MQSIHAEAPRAVPLSYPMGRYSLLKELASSTLEEAVNLVEAGFE